MKRQLACWFVLFLLVAGVTMQNSIAVRGLEEKLARTNAEIRHEEDRLRVLTAEWASLSAPSRIEKLAAEYLQLTPTTPGNMLALHDIPAPMPPEPPATEAIQLAAASAATPPAPLRIAKSVPKPEARQETPESSSKPFLFAHRTDDAIAELISKKNSSGVLWANYKVND